LRIKVEYMDFYGVCQLKPYRLSSA
jgi:hypothetical protein